MRRFRLPDSVVLRAAVVLILALFAFQLSSLVLLNFGFEALLRNSHDTRLAERVVLTKRALAEVSDADRDRVAHSLSSGNLEIHWSRASLVREDGAPTPRTRELERRLRTLVPDLAVEAFRIGYEEDGVADPAVQGANRHRLLASVRLDDGSWVNFSVPPFGFGYHLDAHVLAASVAAGSGIILVAVLLMRRVTRPLRQLAAAAEAYDLSGRSQPVPEEGPAEVRRAAIAFNEMRRRIERLVRERTLALAAVSHDLKTPITRLRLRAEFLDDDTKRRVERDLDDMEIMIRSTTAYLRGNDQLEQRRPLDLSVLVETACEQFRDLGEPVDFAGPPHAIVEGRPVALKRMVENLVGNALKFGGSAEVTVQPSKDHVSVIVSDLGPGIPEAERERVFEPFFRMDPSRSRDTGGTGLGLTIARSIAEGHGGSIVLENNAPHGLRVLVKVPRSAAQTEFSAREGKIRA